MYLRFGTYQWPVNGVRVTSQRAIVRGADGLPWKYIDRIKADGYLEGTTQAGLSTSSFEMKEVLKRSFQDLVFMCDDGSQSDTLLTNSDSLTGVVITDGPNFNDSTGPEYVNQRHFEFTAEADYLFNGSSSRFYLDWSETVSISGGGPLYTVMPALFGPPQRQMIFERTPCVAVQSGFAVGATGYPAEPRPIWPFALKNSPEIRRTSPKKLGRANYTEYRIEWNYQFEWHSPLFGFPTLWPKG